MARTLRKEIDGYCARRLSLALIDKLGMPETSSGCDLGRWTSEATWRYRRDNGTEWARLGFGPTRKMITLSYRDGQPGAMLFVYIA